MSAKVSCDKGHAYKRSCREAAIQIAGNVSVGTCSKSGCNAAVRYIVEHEYPNDPHKSIYELIRVARLKSIEEIEREGHDPMLFLLKSRDNGEEWVWPFYWGLDKANRWRVGQFAPMVTLGELQKGVKALEK